MGALTCVLERRSKLLLLGDTGGDSGRLEGRGGSEMNDPGAGTGLLSQNVTEVIRTVLSGETHPNCGKSLIQTIKKKKCQLLFKSDPKEPQAAALSRPSKRPS